MPARHMVFAVVAVALAVPGTATAVSPPGTQVVSPAPARPTGVERVGADFDGDGFDDLAIGVFGEGLGETGVAGAVNVIYGSAGGLAAAEDQLWHQDVEGIRGVAEEGNTFGYALASGDFDGDGFSDLAVGVPNEDASGILGAGAVNVIYGSPQDLTAIENQLWSAASPGMPGGPEEDGRFGEVLVAGNFGNGPEDDLAIGSPGGNVGGQVTVMYGSPNGLSTGSSQLWSQASRGVRETPEQFEQFGRGLAAGDLGRGPEDELVVGAPHEKLGPQGSEIQAGAVHVLYGTAAGLTASGNQLWTQDSPGIEDVAESFDEFGSALAVADFGKSSHGDLAIGVPGESLLEELNFNGWVQVIYGSTNGLRSTGDQILLQGFDGMQDAPESGDNFGRALAAADFGSNAHADLAVGIPAEDLGPDGSVINAGAVAVVYGGASGLNPQANQLWGRSFGTPDIRGECGEGDAFGWPLAVGDYGVGGRADLAIGVPWEGEGFAAVGDISVLYGQPSGFGATGNQLWSQDSPSIENVSEDFDFFGWSLA